MKFFVGILGFCFAVKKFEFLGFGLGSMDGN
jgi:hypothetical protein